MGSSPLSPSSVEGGFGDKIGNDIHDFYMKDEIGNEAWHKKYNSPYPSVRTYRCDKNFVVRLKAMINRMLSEAGHKLPNEFFDRFDDADEYLFESTSITEPGQGVKTAEDMLLDIMEKGKPEGATMLPVEELKKDLLFNLSIQAMEEYAEQYRNQGTQSPEHKNN